tara:strand:- start:393 stop:524 length:132 start_codon:yes stop_codon:yes gene_type:complete
MKVLTAEDSKEFAILYSVHAPDLSTAYDYLAVSKFDIILMNTY